MNNTIDQLCINTIRTLSIDAVQQANSGHPGTPMAMAPVIYTLFDRYMKFNPANPDWMNRDRFILSVGHASMLLYSALHISGYDVSLEDIKAFRQLNSKCPGHPEYGHTPGVETTTGPLGQGLATSVGFAIAQKWLEARYNKDGYTLFDYKIYSMAGDGCMMEGLSGEAASLAGHLGLNNLIWIYDNNNITIEGNTSLAFSEDVGARFVSYGWDVLKVADANNLKELEAAFNKAKAAPEKPTLIIVDSHIAYGAPNKVDTAGAHGSPLGEEEIRAAKEFYGWDPDKKFVVPDEVGQYRSQILARAKKQNDQWNEQYTAYKEKYPTLASEIELIRKHELPSGWDAEVPVFEAGTKISGRKAGSQALNAIASKIPFMIGGSADLAPSTLTDLKNETSFQKDNFSGRNLHYGIREHAMGAIANGIALSGLKTYASTFLVFSDYARGAMRLSALMNLPVTYVFTHDSIGVGEDGPTHQPIEHLASLRAMPNLEVIRPADANEVAVLWKYIIRSKNTPTALILSRQDLAVFDRTKYASAEGALRGAYVLAGGEEDPEVILMASGSEVQLAVEAYEQLQKEGLKARVVSMPDWKLFERQDAEYRESVLPSSVHARIAIEAATGFGWERYTGIHEKSAVIGMKSFGASGKINSIQEEFGFTVENIISTVKSLITNK
ncbi:MAG: transketolase [Bacteroidales bacterium]|nr:transketolase [Bacteroidales bacterium]